MMIYSRLIILAGSFVALLPVIANAQSLEWVGQLGTSTHDESHSVSADGLGNVYISGTTLGSLGGPNAGSNDAFVSKYDAAGTLQWSRQLGTNYGDASYGVSADGLGNVYITGYTRGPLGGFNPGGRDAFVAKYDAAGTLQWTRQWGTGFEDQSYGVSADGLGNVYITGVTGGWVPPPFGGDWDAFVAKYDAAGTLQWSRQLGTVSRDVSNSVSADGLGNVYISGYTIDSLGGLSAGDYDAFVSKYDSAGTLQWVRQLGSTSEDESRGVSADGLGNVYISGRTFGNLGGPNTGSENAFLSSYDAAGTLQWTRKLGTNTVNTSFGVSADRLGSVYITGYTFGSLDGPNAGGNDAFLSKYNAAGALLWTQQLGTSTGDVSGGVSADSRGNVYISGYTLGSLGGPTAGGEDAFVAKIADVPEPSACALMLMAALTCTASRPKHRQHGCLRGRKGHCTFASRQQRADSLRLINTRIKYPQHVIDGRPRSLGNEPRFSTSEGDALNLLHHDIARQLRSRRHGYVKRVIAKRIRHRTEHRHTRVAIELGLADH